MFGEEIKKYRKENGVSLRALAEKIGVSFTYISYIEKGRAMPAPSIIKKLADTIGVPYEKALAEVYEDVGNGLYQTYLTDTELKERLAKHLCAVEEG